MIVILRRIRQAAGRVTGTDWVLVAVEGLLVFLGIVAAFQLQEWAEDRREARQVERLLGQLLDETRTGLQDLIYFNRGGASGVRAMRAAQAELDAGRCPADMSHVGFIGLLKVRVSPTRPAFEELVNTVGLSAVPDSDVRAAMLAYDYQQSAYVLALEDFEPPTIVDRDDPRARLRLESTGVDDDPLTLEFPGIWVERFKSAFDYDREALCADRAFAQRHAHALYFLEAIQGMRADTIVRTADLCLRLADHLDTDCFGGTLADLDPKIVARLQDNVAAYRPLLRSSRLTEEDEYGPIR